MNKHLLLTIIVVSMIPGLFAIGKGIEDMTGNTIYTPINSGSLVMLYFTAATITLGIALVILLKTYSNTSTNSNKINHKHMFHPKIKFLVGMHPHNIFKTNSANTIRPEQAIVIIVAIVALIAIAIII